MRAKQGGNLNLFVMVGWLVVFNVPSTARAFRNGTPIYCPLRRTVPIGNRTTGRRVAVHYNTAAPRQLNTFVMVFGVTRPWPEPTVICMRSGQAYKKAY